MRWRRSPESPAGLRRRRQRSAAGPWSAEGALYFQADDGLLYALDRPAVGALARAGDGQALVRLPPGDPGPA